MTVKEYFKDLSPNQFHIFDSHQEAMGERGVAHEDQDYVAYSYNIHKNNKPKQGDAFLYRRPGKSSPSRRFYIYGGGIIQDIGEPDREGNVLAYIEKPFKLKEQLIQGESKFLEEFEWSSKEKQKGSWGHFWNQYGMNVINEQDYFGLVGELDCTIPGNYNVFPATPAEFAEEDHIAVSKLDPTGFRVDISGDDISGKVPNSNGVQSINGRHIDYVELEHTKLTLGKAGELLVFEMLREQLDCREAMVEHTSVFKGDGYGYDIKIIYKDGRETHIEVKTTKSSYVDGFYITPRELNASRQLEDYQVYRVYNYDPINKRANIIIYKAPFKDEDFRFVPVSWKVHLR